MAIINTIGINESKAIDFIMNCMDVIKSEADVQELAEVNIKYLKTFIDTFDKNEILPILNKAQTLYNNQLNGIPIYRPIDIDARKKKNEIEAANGTRTVQVVESELPTWPLCFKNPIKIAQKFGSVPTGTKKKKGMSVMTNAKLISQINALNNVFATREKIIYLIEYFLKFFFIDKEKEYFNEYNLFLDKLLELGYTPKDRNNCFLVKNQEQIETDIIALFLCEDCNISKNKDFLMVCIDRYHELFS